MRSTQTHPATTALDLAGTGRWRVTTTTGVWEIDLDDVTLRHADQPWVDVITVAPVRVGNALRARIAPPRRARWVDIDGGTVTGIASA